MIKDVSREWAMLMESVKDEFQKYADACDEACKKAKEIEEEEIDSYDEEVVDPCECGFNECDVKVDEVVDPLQMWKDMKKDSKGSALVPVDYKYIETMKKLLSKIKSSKAVVYNRVMAKLEEYRKNGTSLPPPEDYVENFIPFDEIQRAGGEDSYSDTDNAFGNKDAEENLWDTMNEDQQADVKKQVSTEFKNAKDEVKTATKQEVKEFLAKNKGAIEDAQRKINDPKVNGDIAKVVEFLEKYSEGKVEDNEGNQALGEAGKVGFWSPVVALAKGCLRFLVWLLRLTGLTVFGIGWLVKIIGKVSADLCARLDRALAECEIMECDGEDCEELDETGCNEAKKKKKFVGGMPYNPYDEGGEGEGGEDGGDAGCCDGGALEEADYREAASHLLDPVGVKASTASLKAQDTAALSIVEKLLNKIDILEKKIEESRAEKNSAEAASSKSALNEADTLADIKTVDKWYAHLMKACCSVPEDPKLIETLLKIIKQIEKNLQQEYFKPGDWEKFSVLWKDHFLAQDLLNYFTQTSNQYGLVLLTQMNPAQFIDPKEDYKKAIKDFQNKTADCRKFLNDKSQNVANVMTKLKETEEDDKWSKMSLEEQENEELKGWGLTDDQIATLDIINKVEDNADVKRHLTPEETKKFKFYRELSFKRELTDQEKKDFIELVKGVDSEEIYDIIDQMEGNSFFGKSELFNYKDSMEDRTRLRTIRKRIPKLRQQIDTARYEGKNDVVQDLEKKLAAEIEDLKKMSPEDPLLKIDYGIDKGSKIPVKGQDTWTAQEWNAFIGTADKKQKKELMDELISDIEKRYPDKTDKESQKKKAEEMMYVWKLFNHEATTREFGKAFNSSHAGAGKYINATVDMWRDAIKLVCKQNGLEFKASVFDEILSDNKLFNKFKYILGELSKTRKRVKI